MAITSYSELQTQISNWTNFADSTFDTQRAVFIELAEAKIKDDVRFLAMERRAEATLSTTTKYLALPTNFIEGISFQLETTPLVTLEYMSPNQINRVNNSSSGQPKFYSVVGDEFLFNKIPDSAYTAELAYYIFAPLSDSNTSNDVLEKYPSLYLNLSLAEAYRYLKDEQRANYYDGLGQAQIDQIRDAARRKHLMAPVNVRTSGKVV